MRNSGFIFSLNFLYLVLIAAESAAIVFLCLYLPVFMPVAAAFAAVWLINLIALCVMLARGGGAEKKLALALMIVALPVAGAAVYFLGSAAKKRAKFSVRGKGRCGACRAGYDQAEYFDNGGDYFKRLLEEIDGAKVSIYIEYFIICRGKLYGELYAALARAAERGVDIRVIADGVGSAFKLNRRELKELKKIAKVKVFNKLAPLPLPRTNTRDHRKIAVIDGKTVFTGGINLADEYANVISPFGHWKDSGVAVRGGAAKIFEGMFLSVWNGEYEAPPPEGGEFKCTALCDSPPDDDFARKEFEAMIYSAKERVHIMTPYFCVGEGLASALSFAAAKGVDVKIILPHVPDKKYAFALSKACAAELACDGVKFYEYTPGFMHAKCLIADGKAYIGSYNFDFRSLGLNYECGIIFDGEIVVQAEKDFAECISKSQIMEDAKCGRIKNFTRLLLKLFAPLI